jgi:hypothetical protein
MTAREAVCILNLDAISFARAPVSCINPAGETLTRWISYGLPQLEKFESIPDVVFFLHANRIEAKEGRHPGGMGFLAAVPSARWPEKFQHVHAVTNWQLVAGSVNSPPTPVIRLDTRSGVPEIFEFDPAEWTGMPGVNDVAVSPPLSLDGRIHRAAAIPLASFIRADGGDIAPGENVFTIGRYADRDSKNFIFPANRFGQVKALSPALRLQLGIGKRSIVLDMPIRSAFTGGPVIVYRSTVPGFVDENGAAAIGSHSVRLLGIHSGQFPEAPQDSGAAGPGGIASVTPAGRIKAVLDLPHLRRMRDEHEQKFLAAGAETQPAGAV